MRTTALTAPAFILFVCLVDLVAAQPVFINQVPKEITPSKDAIHSFSEQTTGLSMSIAETGVEMIPAPNADLPFLTDEQLGGRVLRISHKRVRFSLPSTPAGELSSLSGECEILLDEQAKNLVRVRFRPDHRRSKKAAITSKASAEAQLRRQGIKYVWFPKTKPNVTFAQAIDAVLARGVGTPTMATQIEGIYVMYVRAGAEPIAVWIVTLRGLPPFHPIGGPPESVPESQRDFIHNIIDAVTGKWLSATNMPHPD